MNLDHKNLHKNQEKYNKEEFKQLQDSKMSPNLEKMKFL